MFQQYARYYDLLYADKDYDGEAAFVADIIRRQNPDAKSILELGSGTGLHAMALARQGYSVTGFDLSPEMTIQARNRLSKTVLPQGVSVSFEKGDIRTLRLPRRFDAAISLFHVMSYQTNNSDIEACLTTAFMHLEKTGVFVFDYWHGQAVTNDPPTVRVKRMEDHTMTVTRIAHPTIRPDDNLVEVRYELTIQDRTTGQTKQVCEDHRMRYFAEHEVERFLKGAGLEPIEQGEWSSSQPTKAGTWSAYVVAVPMAAHGEKTH